MTTTKLPELPEPDCSTDDAQHGAGEPAYTLETLRAYGDEREAYGRATAPAEVGDGFVMVERCALNLALNALRRDAAEGKAVRGEIADALAAATRPAPGRDGFVPVPVEPTEAMADAYEGWSARGLRGKMRDFSRGAYAAMLAAAPAPRSEP